MSQKNKNIILKLFKRKKEINKSFKFSKKLYLLTVQYNLKRTFSTYLLKKVLFWKELYCIYLYQCFLKIIKWKVKRNQVQNKIWYFVELGQLKMHSAIKTRPISSGSLINLEYCFKCFSIYIYKKINFCFVLLPGTLFWYKQNWHVHFFL